MHAEHTLRRIEGVFDVGVCLFAGYVRGLLLPVRRLVTVHNALDAAFTLRVITEIGPDIGRQVAR